MGWDNCGVDSRGRSIGYVFSGTCDHPDCLKKIDRGLSYACGDTHGGDEYSCEKYFCDAHKRFTIKNSDGIYVTVCKDCFDKFEGELTWK